MSDEREPFERAPIVEAVIDLQVLPPDGLGLDSLAAIEARLTGGYGKPKEISQDRFEFAAGQSGARTQVSRERLGLQFERADGRRVLQARTNGFTFSAMAPYDRWSAFRKEARELWDLYREVARPTTVTRVAVRYINRIDLPLPPDERAEPLRIETYFNTYPEIAEHLRYNAYARFIMELQVPQPDIESLLVIRQALVDPPSPEVVSIILDFDLFRGGEWNALDDAPIWEFLEVLRERKNEAFESSITDNARRLFQ